MDKLFFANQKSERTGNERKEKEEENKEKEKG